MLSLFDDLRYALRQLRKAPGMALLAILTLALGIGANTAIFTVIESVLLRPLPYNHAERLMRIGQQDKKGSVGQTSWRDYRGLRDQSRQFEQMALFSEDVGVIETQGASISTVAPRVTPNIFPMLGIQPRMGRTFHEDEALPGSPPVVLLSEGLWRESFHADPGIVGHTIRVNSTAHIVVGVMPGDFRFPESMGTDVDKGIWLPLQPSQEMLTNRGYQFFSILGKLHTGTTPLQARQELNTIAARIFPDEHNTTSIFNAISYQQTLTGPVRPVLLALFAALGLVLLIACANVSNMMIARCLARQQEFAVRSALGASRTRMIRQLLAEGLSLSLPGSAAGILLAELALRLVRSLPKNTLPSAETIAMHWPVLLALAAIAILSTLLSSLLPALLVVRSHPQAALQAASRGLGNRSLGSRLSGLLIVGEVALSTLLLVGTGLLFHTLWNLERSRLGFETAHLTTFTATPADASGMSEITVSSDVKNASVSTASMVYLPVLERIRHLPGITHAALMTAPPFSGVSIKSGFTIVDQAADPNLSPQARVSSISGDYARAMGTPLLRGRMIEDSDTASAPFVVVINETLAKRYFPNQNPLGKQIDLGGKETGMIQPFTIVGVLGDQIDKKVGTPADPQMLISMQQIPTTSLYYPALLKTQVSFVVKTRGNIPLISEVRSLFHQYAPGYALDDFQTMQDAVEKNTFSQRLSLYLIASFAGLAMLMVITGLYGVLSRLVSYRRREIGVRMALGASKASVSRLILRQGALLVGTGLIAGVLLSVAAGRLIRSFLYQVHPLDLWTYTIVLLTLSLIGLIASVLPARKAASIEPIQALREE